MFDKFGEMNSYKDINELAENLFNEGDMDGIRVMAKENGIPEDFVGMYLEGMIPELCDSTTAAVGKLDVEMKELKLKGLMLDWVEYIKGLCMAMHRPFIYSTQSSIRPFNFNSFISTSSFPTAAVVESQSSGIIPSRYMPTKSSGIPFSFAITRIPSISPSLKRFSANSLISL